MATARIDRVDVLEVEERFGVVLGMTRRARVVDLVATDYRVLTAALATAGIPAVGSSLTGIPNLVLASRKVKLVDGDPSAADVDLIYEVGYNDGQNMDNPPFGVLLGQVSTTINQVKSNLDVDGNTVSVQHEYPADDPDYAGQIVVQGGEFDYFQPQKTVRFTGIKTTFVPHLIALGIVGYVNKQPWLGGAEAEWMCTSCAYEPYSSLNKWKFTIEFQHNPDSFDPTVTFIDERTSKPPVNLVADVGYKTVKKHPRTNFEGVIGVRVQGG